MKAGRHKSPAFLGKVIPIGKYDAQTAWKTAHTTRVVVNLNHNTDAEILLHLSQQENKQGYIKELIRKDMQTSHTAKS